MNKNFQEMFAKAKREKRWRQLFETYFVNDKFLNRPVGEFMSGYKIAQEYLEKQLHNGFIFCTITNNNFDNKKETKCLKLFP